MPISLDCVAEAMALDGEWWRRADGWRVELYYPEGWRQARGVAFTLPAEPASVLDALSQLVARYPDKARTWAYGYEDVLGL
jgi:hypothetical protein